MINNYCQSSGFIKNKIKHKIVLILIQKLKKRAYVKGIVDKVKN